MQQPQYKSNFEIKFLARMHTGQHLGILISATLVKFIITIFAVNLVSILIPVGTTIGYLVNYILVFFRPGSHFCFKCRHSVHIFKICM